MLCPLPLARSGFPHSPLPQGFIGILRDPTPPSHSQFDFAYIGVRRLLRNVPWMRGSLRAVAKNISASSHAPEKE